MYTDIKARNEKIETAYQLLNEDTTTLEKFEKTRTLLKGINPRIDKLLTNTSNAIKKLHHINQGDVIELSAEHLPEHSEEQKKRKRALLLFITSWKSLKAEVKRVHAELNNAGKSPSHQLKTAGRIVSFAKGPLGIITALALIIAGTLIFLERSAVSITITNRGCSPITPIIRSPIAIPGIKLPSETIVDGGSTVATVPPLTVTVDGARSGLVVISAYGLTMTYNLPASGVDVIFDNQSLIGKHTTINLGELKTHQLILQCS